MPVPRHLFVCVHHRVGGGKPSCAERGGRQLVTALELRLLTEPGSGARVTASGCLGPCFDGPNAVLYPDGTWYAELDSPDDDSAGLAEHLLRGEVYSAKSARAPGSDD